MKVIAFISFALALCVLVAGMLGEILNIVETFFLTALGCISLAVDKIRIGQRDLQSDLKRISATLSRLDNTLALGANSLEEIKVRERESPKTEEEIVELLNTPAER